MSPHVERGQWPVLLSSAEVDADAELSAALAHAKECADCERERGAAQAFLSQLSALPPLPGPRAEVLAAAKAPILAELASAQWTPARWKALFGVLAFGVLVATARHRATNWSSLIVGAVLLLIAVTFLAARRWPRVFQWPAALWFVPALLYLPMKALATTPGFELGHGFDCAGVELLAAVLPVGALWFAVRRGAAARPFDFALAGVGGALAGQAALALTCPSHSLGHLLVFHSLVVMVAGLLGAAVGRLQASPTEAR